MNIETRRGAVTKGSHSGLWHTVREYLTHWTVAGLLLAATGAAPEHWVADAVHQVPFSLEASPHWLTNLDYRLLAVIAGLTIVVGDTVWRNHRHPVSRNAEASTPDNGIHRSLLNRASIAVLPFQNLSGDVEQEYVADGMTEEIITALSRVHWMFVIARNSSFVYKGKATDVRQIARDLDVRYVLEGSVRKASGTVRITAQLIETVTGANVWANRFDGRLVNVFALQDEVNDNIVRAIAPAMRHAEIDRTRRKTPASMDAYDYYLRALPRFYAATHEDNDEGLRLLDRSLALEPHFELALALRAHLLAWRDQGGRNRSALAIQNCYGSHETLFSLILMIRRYLPAPPILLPGRVAIMRKRRNYAHVLMRSVPTQASIGSRPVCRSSIVGAGKSPLLA
ncbi:MAG: hypothetical protein ABSE20_11845 [Acetobacteraceae bacterium]